MGLCTIRLTWAALPIEGKFDFGRFVSSVATAMKMTRERKVYAALFALAVVALGVDKFVLGPPESQAAVYSAQPTTPPPRSPTSPSNPKTCSAPSTASWVWTARANTRPPSAAHPKSSTAARLFRDSWHSGLYHPASVGRWLCQRRTMRPCELRPANAAAGRICSVAPRKCLMGVTRPGAATFTALKRFPEADRTVVG